MADSKITELGSNTTPIGTDIIPIVDDPGGTPVTQKITLANLGLIDGWIPVGDSWTYASADAPTFTITVPSGAASLYGVGDRIKLTQTTVKYFIVTAVADELLTVYGGTDYTLVDAAISAISYSHQKSPLGFPLSPAKWTVKTTYTSNTAQANPTNGTWYNIGTVTISIPIGCWEVGYQVVAGATDAGITETAVNVTLSTANNSESDGEFTSYTSVGTANATVDAGTIYRQKTLLIATKTPYYLNLKTTNNGLDSLYHFGGVGDTVIRAVCAYL